METKRPLEGGTVFVDRALLEEILGGSTARRADAARSAKGEKDPPPGWQGEPRRHAAWLGRSGKG